jgi:protein tyrosine/serine phosphatase
MKPAFSPQPCPAFLKVFVVLLLPCLLLGCSDPVFVFSGEDLPYNFYELDPGKAYRSSQPTGPQLKNAIGMLGLKTVINLRGPNPGVDWYDQEVAVCKEMNVPLADFPMSSGSLPEPDLLKGIVNTLKTAEYPILIHCAGGSDRTGAVSAIYKMLIDGADKSVAREQLSPRYFHFQVNAPSMDRLLELYEPTDEWLATYTQEYPQLTGSAGSGQ